MSPLVEAWAGVDEALAIISQLWRDCQGARTPRLADAVSLLDRGWSKLEKEALAGAGPDEEKKMSRRLFAEAKARREGSR